jgi:peroxiredoxin
MVAVAAVGWAAPLVQAARVGQPAPDFAVTDSNSKVQKLSDYAGKFVVLEWSNRGCPFTQKHYSSGNMQRLQREWTQRGVIWFTVISSAPGKQGYVSAADENAWLKKINAAPTAVLLDPQGTLGHLYDAKTTPQMFVINPQGTVVYDGAIDDKPTTDLADVARGAELSFSGAPRGDGREAGEHGYEQALRLLGQIPGNVVLREIGWLRRSFAGTAD